MTIFIDSSAFRAIYNPTDQYHRLATLRFVDLKKDGYKVMVSDYIIDESHTGILTSAGYKNVMEFDALVREGNMKLEKITPERFAAAQEIFRRYNKDKEWSFTDCTSYVVMKELKIKKVFTFDQNFSEMGFEVL
jgi:predicted nucleic acid-binding protein